MSAARLRMLVAALAFAGTVWAVLGILGTTSGTTVGVQVRDAAVPRATSDAEAGVAPPASTATPPPPDLPARPSPDAANAAPAAAPAAVPHVVPAAVPVEAGMRLQLEGFGVDAPVQVMGFQRDTGEMEIPAEAGVVAWYDFSAQPGQPGNAVFAAHVNYAGHPGAFVDLHRMAVGDEVTVQGASGVLHYRVVEAYRVPADGAEIAAIIGERSGHSTLTLITCGGDFDTAQRAYVDRVIVRAALLGGSG